MPLLIGLLALASLTSPTAAPAPEATPAAAVPAPRGPAAPGLLAPGNYVLFSPGGVGFTGIADAATVSFVYGIDAGHYFTAGKRFAAALGGFFEHIIVGFLPGEGSADDSITTLQSLRLGTVLRVGVRFRRLFAYGLGRLGTDLTLNYDLIDEDYETGKITRRHYKVYPWIMGSAGVGAQGLIGRRFLLGGEGAADIGGEAFFQFRFSLLLGVRF